MELIARCQAAGTECFHGCYARNPTRCLGRGWRAAGRGVHFVGAVLGAAANVQFGEFRRRDGGRHPEDQARRDHHAGEPVVRLVLRHLSGGRRHSREQRAVHRLRARSAHRRLRQAVSRLQPGERRCRARSQQRGHGHRRRQDGRLRQVRGRHRQPGLLGHQPADPGVPAERRTRRDGLPRRAGDPELLDVRQRLRAERPHVRAGRLVVPAVPPVPGQRVVGAVRFRQPGQLRQRPGAGRGRRACAAREPARGLHELPAHARREAAEEGQPHQPESRRGDLSVPRRADPRAAPAAPRQRRRGRAARRLLVDGPDLPAAQGQRVLGLLRAAGRPARLRRQPRRDRGRLRAGRPGRRDPVRSGTRCRRSPT